MYTTYLVSGTTNNYQVITSNKNKNSKMQHSIDSEHHQTPPPALREKVDADVDPAYLWHDWPRVMYVTTIILFISSFFFHLRHILTCEAL